MHDVLEDMRKELVLRGLSASTAESYLRYARKFLQHVAKPLGEISNEDVRQHLLGLAERGVSAPTRNQRLAAIRFLFDVLDRPEVTRGIRRAKLTRSEPVVLSGTEVERLLAAVRSISHRAMLMTLYGAGLRVGELCRLRIEDVDSKRMLLRIRKSKTGDRYVMLSRRVLEALRAHYRVKRPAGPYLFPGRYADKPLTKQAVRKVLVKALRRAGITKHVTPHTLRHSFALHLLELGANVRLVQVALGHARITSTARYLPLSPTRIAQTFSPLDQLGSPAARVLG